MKLCFCTHWVVARWAAMTRELLTASLEGLGTTGDRCGLDPALTPAAIPTSKASCCTKHKRVLESSFSHSSELHACPTPPNGWQNLTQGQQTLLLSSVQIGVKSHGGHLGSDSTSPQRQHLPPSLSPGFTWPYETPGFPSEKGDSTSEVPLAVSRKVWKCKHEELRAQQARGWAHHWRPDWLTPDLSLHMDLPCVAALIQIKSTARAVWLQTP